MTHYESRFGIEYAVKDPGEITVDDPVGNYLFVRAENYPGKGPIIFKQKRSWSELLDDFESGNMTKKTYDYLLMKKVKRKKSFSKERGEKRALQIFHDKEIDSVLGDIKANLTEQERADLQSASETGVDGLKEFLRQYFATKLPQIAKVSDYNQDILKAAEQGDIKTLEKRVISYRVVASGLVNHFYGRLLAYPDNKKLKEEFYIATQKLDIITIGKTLAQLRKMYPKIEGAKIGRAQ